MEKQAIQLIKSAESYKLTVTLQLEKMIRFLCDKLPRNEWSGTLFYTVEGSFKDKNLHVICKDFFLQDVGASTYTEFKNDVELAAYMADHELWDCYTGLMHSHDMMSTFFSGTDLATLKEEGNDSNHFLSLIVNNAGSYTAAITRKVRTITKGNQTLKYNTFNNNVVADESTAYEKEESYIEYYPLEITVETIPATPKSELELRLEEIKNSANSYLNKPVKSFNAINTVYPIDNYTKKYPFLEDSPKENKESKEKKYIQGTLFSSKEMGEKPKVQTEEDYSINYDEDHINSTTIDNNVTQIITGDIFAHYKSNIDLSKWAENMKALYDKRFKDNFESFSYWVDTFIEFLENDLPEDALDAKGPDYKSAIWAFDLISKLEKVKKNKYLDAFITTLERWLI